MIAESEQDCPSPSATIPNQQTDWNKCCPCQQDKKDELKSPPSYKAEHDDYCNIAENVPLFHAINELPIPLNPARLNDGDGIGETLRKNKAVYHQTCRLMFNNTKLKRAQKRKSSTDTSNEEVQSKVEKD